MLLRELLQTRHGAPLVLPGAPDALTARLAREIGFEAVYVTGAGVTNRYLGVPDLGLITLSELADHVEAIRDAVDIPIVVDADTGFGGPLNVRRTVQVLERRGANAIQLEDQVFPKRCGHFAGKETIAAAEMVAKLQAALDARGDDSLLIVARTDARQEFGLEEALERAESYREAGADVIFVEAPVSEAQIETIARRLPFPKLLNMFEGGKTPLVPLARLHALGYRIVIIPSDLQRAAIRAMQDVLVAITRDGNSRAVADRMASFTEREAIVGTVDYLKLDQEDSR